MVKLRELICDTIALNSHANVGIWPMGFVVCFHVTLSTSNTNQVAWQYLCLFPVA
jgi:hypothetical protein